MADYRYKTGPRWADEGLERHCACSRSLDEQSLAEELDRTGREISKLIAWQSELRKQVQGICLHPIEDAVYTSVGIRDTLGNYGGGLDYITCKLCGTELFREYTR